MSDNEFYLTTPIYYVNARPHIGHAYTTIVADVLARRHRLLGPNGNQDTFFLTGTDEHGQKIERSAAAAGIPPQQFADQVSKSFEDLWLRMGITNDAYIRTTDPQHKRGVQHLFAELYARGFIELRSYTGQYCVSDEAFVDVAPGEPCPDCGRITETLSEENFFFKLSSFQEQLVHLIESDQLLITPGTARNEVLSFVRGNIASVFGHDELRKSWGDNQVTFEEMGREAVRLGRAKEYAPGKFLVHRALKDLSISRSSFTWGIPVPEPAASAAAQNHVIYVWLDALANYMTAIGYGSDDPAEQAKFKKFWPADLHLVGKEIIRFHCVYWPAFLLALNPKLQHKSDEKPPSLSLEEHKAWAKDWLPKAITAHGWLLFDDSKMSKSKGNIVRTETILDAFGTLCPPPALDSTGLQPGELEKLASGALAPGTFPTEPTPHDRDLFASDVLRYFLLREIPFGQDGSFSFDALITRYNADLANGYGNLVSRTLNMISQNCDSTVPFVPQYMLTDIDGDSAVHRVSQQGLLQNQQIDESYVKATIQLRKNSIETAYITCDFFPLAESLAIAVSTVDAYLSYQAPWKRAKLADPFSQRQLHDTLYVAAESIRIITALLYPILPYATARVWAQLGLGSIEQAAAEGKLKNLQWGGLQPGTKLGPLSPIFPRADKGLAQMMIDMETLPSRTTENEQRLTETEELLADTQPPTALSTDPAAPPRPIATTNPGGPLPVAGSTAHTAGPDHAPSHANTVPSAPFNTVASQTPITASPTDASPQITIDDFAKIELRVAQILVAERIPKADKLLRLEVDLGPHGKRQILSGIAEWYTPEDLIGRRIVVITNLAPRKMRGLESHGMLLAASNGENGKPVLATFGEDIALGSRLK